MGKAEAADERRVRIGENIHDRDPKLAGVYRTALRVLESAREPGSEAARVSVICHCMRELTNGLPAAFADTVIPRPVPSSSSLLAQLPHVLAKHPGVDLALEQDFLPVPKTVAFHIGALVQARIQEDGRNVSNIRALIAGTETSPQPAVRQWKEANAFFLKWTHLDRTHDRPRELPTDQELTAWIRIVEDIVEVRAAVFFENLRALEDLLSVINTPVAEG